MKIAFLHMTMGLTSRGSEVVVSEIASELSKSNEVLVIQSGPLAKNLFKAIRVYPLAIAPPTSPTNPVEKLLFRMHLDKESGAVAEFSRAALPTLASFDPDIIVVINGSTQLRVLSSQNYRAKIVCFGHAGVGHHDRSTILRSPDLFVALSRPAYSWAKNMARSKTKVAYIPNPITVSKAKQIDLKLSSPVVMCVSALSAYKNVSNVVDAIKITGSSLLLIGDGEQREDLQSQLSTLPSEFRWIKYIDPVELPSYYASADVFCFVPDPQEAFGRVYLEAMAQGLPIVASDDPIRREIVGEKGSYADPHDPESIAREIAGASQLSKIDYSNELSPFELSNVIARIEKEFHDLIK